MRIKETRIKKMLRECRFSFNLSISDLASTLEVSEQEVLNWIAEESIPSYHQRMRIYELYAPLEAAKTVADELESKNSKRIKTNISMLLKELKDFHGYTQIQLGDHLGYNQSAICRWLNGYSVPHPASAEVIIAAFRALPNSPDELSLWRLYHNDLNARDIRKKSKRKQNAAE
jgi:transcriptional regulator with XRE-family HTH domain